MDFQALGFNDNRISLHLNINKAKIYIMSNYIGSFLLFFCVVSSSFSQTKTIEKGTYISTDKGQKIRLNLLEDNKYELVFYSGNYEIKGDSLLFIRNTNKETAFDLSFKNDKKAKKIKVKFLDPSYYSFYIGTQKGTEAVQYQRLSDIKDRVNPDGDKADAEFEIDRADFLYLVFEQYGGDSKLSKFALPKEVSEVTIKYRLDLLGDLNLSGFFDKKANQLIISEQSGKNLSVFRNEKDIQPEKISKIVPLENKTISNWTYPGKEPLASEDFGYEAGADSTAAAADSAYYPSAKFDFKFKIENNLKSALNTTKIAKNKFLVISTDNKNPSAKADFDSFLKDMEAQMAYLMYDGYLPEYDIFNYYLATAEDKKWLKSNKIADDQRVIVLNNNGEILASSKSPLSDIKTEFGYYSDKKLQRANTLYSFNKVIRDKKTTNTDLIMAFNNVAVNELPYDYPVVEVNDDEKAATLKFVKITLDKKEVFQTWKKLIEAHQKDTKPNKYLAETILKEIKNQGYSKQLFDEERELNDTDFLAIDYLLKHYDAIEKMNIEDENGHAIVLYKGNLSAEISSSLQQNTYIPEGNFSENTIRNNIAVYKKMIALGKGNYDCYKNYFDYLILQTEKSPDDITFLKEFNSYFNAYLSTDKGNAIERLDEMFSANNNPDWNYDGWGSFKEYHSNLANTAAWAVVQKPANSNFIKEAVSWSEYSLIISKNNPYYLDTLAQLYYKDGQKEKAIATQQLAVKFLTAEVEDQTATEIKETLTKMQNGTY